VGACRGGGDDLGLVRPRAAIGDVSEMLVEKRTGSWGELPAQVGEPVVSEVDLIDRRRRAGHRRRRPRAPDDTLAERAVADEVHA